MRKILLSCGRFVLVDEDDFDRLSKSKWWVTNGYASTRIEGRFTYMHREIMRAGSGDKVDHINHDTLDNRKENLRLANDRQNIGNSRPYGRSRYKGVFPVSNTKGKPWRAQINKQGRSVYLGCFWTQEEAAAAYNEAAVEYFGEFAWLNPVPDAA